MKIEYFGTNFTEHGHYRWVIEDGLHFQNLIFRDLPFDPERLTNNLPKGETVFYQGGGYTVFGISGSPVDKRGGTKSIFWVDQIISKDKLISILLKNETAKKLIDQMPFKIEEIQ